MTIKVSLISQDHQEPPFPYLATTSAKEVVLVVAFEASSPGNGSGRKVMYLLSGNYTTVNWGSLMPIREKVLLENNYA